MFVLFVQVREIGNTQNMCDNDNINSSRYGVR